MSLCLYMQEGAALLAGEELEKTRGQTAAAAGTATEQQEEPTTPTGKIKRTTTMAQTAEVQCAKRCYYISIILTGLYHFTLVT